MDEILRLFTENIFNQFVSVASIIAAVASLATTIVTLVSSYVAGKRKLREAEETKFSKALHSDQLSVVGDYFFSTLGQFTVY